MNKASIQELLSRPVSFNPAIARAVGGVKPGLFLCQLIYWSDRGSDAEWIYKTQAEWEEETCLSRREQETARMKLVASGFVDEKRAGDHGIMHYKVNWEALEKALTNGAKCQTPMAESAKRQWRKAPNMNGGKRQSLNTETTTETTTEGPNEPNPFIEEYQQQYFKRFSVPPRITLKEINCATETIRDYRLTDDEAVEYMRLWGEQWREDLQYWPASLLKFTGELLTRLDKVKAIAQDEDAELLAEMRRLFPDYVPKSERRAI